MRSLKEVANALWAEAGNLKQADRGAYERICDLAQEVHEYGERLEEAIGGEGR